MYDKLSFLKGLALGLAGKPLEFAPKKEPVAYLYNGVRLPKLPEWDKEAYPYAVIDWYEGGFGVAFWRLYLFPVNLSGNGDSAILPGGITYCWYNYKTEEDTAWEYTASATPNNETVFVPIWTNTDILNEDRAVYLAKSDPVPVYE